MRESQFIGNSNYSTQCLHRLIHRESRANKIHKICSGWFCFANKLVNCQWTTLISEPNSWRSHRLSHWANTLYKCAMTLTAKRENLQARLESLCLWVLQFEIASTVVMQNDQWLCIISCCKDFTDCNGYMGWSLINFLHQFLKNSKRINQRHTLHVP